MDDSETITAYHEAGHACMAILLGARVETLTIEPEQENEDFRLGGLAEIHDQKVRDARDQALFQAQVSIAGPVAEMIYTGEPWHPAAVLEWQSDWQRAWQATEGVWSNEQVRMQQLELLTKATYQLLSDDHCWPAVAALADELETHETLEQDQIEEVTTPWLSGHRL